MGEETAADKGVEVADGGLDRPAAVRCESLEQLAVVAVGLAGAKSLAAQTNLTMVERVVEGELVVGGFEIRGLAVGQVAHLQFAQGR